MLRFFVSALLASLPRLAMAQDAAPTTDASPLVAYVQAADPSYKWEVLKTVGGNPAQTTVIKLTSQSWRTTADVDRVLWEHYLVVVKPEKLTTNKAFLIISGSSNDRPAPDGANAVVERIAEATGSIVAELRMIPNQPLVFHNDGVPRKEDDLIGYGWAQYLETGDATWLPRLPMVKSVARAMDCLQEWSEGQGAKIEKFVVGGASKRGWTTWMIGAVDPRVEAIVPIVIDVLNLQQNMQHHAAVYGFWATAIGNYYQHNILQRPTHPRMAELHKIEDPYYYRDRLAMPKYIVNATGDQFFCLDSSQYYFDQLPGEKHLRYVANADHSVDGSIDAVTSIVAFYQMVLEGRKRPTTQWTFEDDGTIRVTSDVAPRAATLWQATNPTARDFRVATIGKAFTSTPLTAEADGSYVARASAPEQGWTASFVELEYDSGGTFPFKVSTAVEVLPKTRPFEGINLAEVPYEPNLKQGGK
jgi:PhoPQ-activated pathogenicity-related protein